jgi:hypothetical protein
MKADGRTCEEGGRIGEGDKVCMGIGEDGKMRS